MYFFTHYSSEESSYCLITIKDYLENKLKNKKITIIDPDVYTLKSSLEYPFVNQLHTLASSKLPANQYITIDYPSDMNPSAKKLFLDKTNENNFKYAQNLQYICAIQFNIKEYVICQGKLYSKPTLDDFKSFEENYNLLSPLFENKKKIVGIGNCCRIRGTNHFTDVLFDFLIDKINQNKIYWIHFYGINMWIIKKYFPLIQGQKVILSTDSTKWTMPHSTELKHKYDKSCNLGERNLFLKLHIQKMQNKGLDVLY